MNYFIFSVIYLYLCNWFRIKTFWGVLSKPRSGSSIVKDSYIFSVVRKKTGIKLKRIFIFETGEVFGMMPGLPIKPELILSRGLYEKLNRDELEWVILHEAAHCKFWHPLKLAITQISILVFGAWCVWFFKVNIVFSGILAFLLSLFCIRIARHFEYRAEKFAINNVDNPTGVITAQDVFGKSKGSESKWLWDEKSFVRKYLFSNILPSERIAMAKKRINIEK